MEASGDNLLRLAVSCIALLRGAQGRPAIVLPQTYETIIASAGALAASSAAALKNMQGQMHVILRFA
jgi:hypothetical protein